MDKTLKMGVGLIPREKDIRRVRLGHMWLYWTETETDRHRSYRGFYPDVDIDYSKYKSGSQARRETITLLKKGLPGRYEVDRRAIFWSTELPDDIINVEWHITEEQLKTDIEQGSTAYFSLTLNPDRTWVEDL